MVSEDYVTTNMTMAQAALHIRNKCFLVFFKIFSALNYPIVNMNGTLEIS